MRYRYQKRAFGAPLERLAVAAIMSARIACSVAMRATASFNQDGTTVKRILFGVIGFYMLAAIATTLAEASGLRRKCGCEPNCWCKRPGLRLFRWVTPKATHHLLTPADKQMLAEAQLMNPGRSD